LRTEGARGAAHQSLRARQVTKLRHRDAAQRERGRIVAQGDLVQGAEGVTRGKRTRRFHNDHVRTAPHVVRPTSVCQFDNRSRGQNVLSGPGVAKSRFAAYG
jgi:hypothetical protein